MQLEHFLNISYSTAFNIDQLKYLLVTFQWFSYIDKIIKPNRPADYREGICMYLAINFGIDIFQKYIISFKNTSFCDPLVYVTHNSCSIYKITLCVTLKIYPRLFAVHYICSAFKPKVTKSYDFKTRELGRRVSTTRTPRDWIQNPKNYDTEFTTTSENLA